MNEQINKQTGRLEERLLCFCFAHEDHHDGKMALTYGRFGD